MPEYNFECEKCEEIFDKVWRITEYNDKLKKVRCPKCRSRKVFRDLSKIDVMPRYVRGLHEVKTLNEYSEIQSKKYGKAKCEEMAREFKKYDDPANRTGGMQELPKGMSRMRGDASSMPAPLSRKDAELRTKPKRARKPKRKGKKA